MVITTGSPTFNVVREIPCCPSAPEPRHSSDHRCIFPSLSGASTWRKECGFRKSSSASFPSSVTSLDSSYVAAMEWCAYAEMPSASAPAMTNNVIRNFICPPEYLLLLFEARIRSLDKHVGRPRTGPRAIESVVIHGGPCRLHLIKRHTLVDQCLNTIPNDCHHVAIVGNITSIAETAVTGN